MNPQSIWRDRLNFRLLIWNTLLLLSMLIIAFNTSKLWSMYWMKRAFVEDHLRYGPGPAEGKNWVGPMLRLTEKKTGSGMRFYLWLTPMGYADIGAFRLAARATYFLYPSQVYTLDETLVAHTDYVVLRKEHEKSFAHFNQTKLRGTFHLIESDEDFRLYGKALSSDTPH